MKVRVLIVDDEPPARRRVRRLLADSPGFEVIGECRDGVEALDAIRAQRPDLVLLDVQMPEVDGFDVLEALNEDEVPTVVFVTAYDEYAVRAFEARALDYLLKPFDAERFDTVMSRAREHVIRRDALGPRLVALLEDVRVSAAGGRRDPDARPLERIPIRKKDRVRVLSATNVDYIEAAGNYVRIHVGDESHLLRDTLKNLESQLDPDRFVRVHRSRIVNLERVRELEPLFKGEFVLKLRDGTRVRTGRTYRDRVRELFHL